MFNSDDSKKHPTEAEIDQTLKESFPASDPPSWTRGIEQRDQPEEEGDQAQGDSDKASAGRTS